MLSNFISTFLKRFLPEKKFKIKLEERYFLEGEVLTKTTNLDYEANYKYYLRLREQASETMSVTMTLEDDGYHVYVGNSSKNYEK